jgi:glycerol-3-phosphate dehydrogenase
MNSPVSANLDDLFDLVVIGGGINGAAIARDAALRGMRVILLEKCDFGSGASSKTSKLAHGGLRYLENFQFSLVRESLKERELLLRLAPHLVHPLPFIMPLYDSDPYTSWQVNLGLFFYDFMGRKGSMPKHWQLSKEELLSNFPSLKQAGLLKGFCYFDAQMNDKRLLIENILSAERAGAIVLNYAPVTKLSIHEGKVNGVYFQKKDSFISQKVEALQVINATGAWANEVSQMEPGIFTRLVSPTKGCHIILPQWIKETLILRAPQDGRIFFIIPWNEVENSNLVGTTDTFFEGSADSVNVESIDKTYLLNAVNFYFPQLNLTASSIIASFAGLRPLNIPSKNSLPSAISRQHQIHISPAGLISICGGKYTSFRKIAEEVIDLSVKRLSKEKLFSPCSTHISSFPGALDFQYYAEIEKNLKEFGLKSEQIKHLLANYGKRSLEILKLLQQDNTQSAPICTDHFHLRAEIQYAIQEEHVQTLEDWFFRRTSIGYSSCKGVKCLEATAALFANYLQWDNSTKNAAIAKYTHYLDFAHFLSSDSRERQAPA